ncbi:MAG: hypothetical protein WB561_23030 [Terracidiphilus sp.]
MNTFRGQNRLLGRRMRSLQWIGCATTLYLAVLTVDVAQPRQDPSSTVNREVPWLPPDAIRLPDKNSQIEMQEQKSKAQSYEIANAARKKQIADDTARLLQLATELKAEVDKTNKETLSLNIIRKADTIEKLAHDVKEKMKLTVF